MNQSDDDVQLGWDGSGAATPPADTTIPATPPPPPAAPVAPTMAQPAAPPVAPAPPQPLGVPAPVPGAPAPPAPIPQAPATPAPTPQVPTAPAATQSFPAQAQQPQMTPAAQYAPPPATGARNTGLWITLAVLCCVIVAGAVVITILLMRGPDTAVSETTQPTSPTSSTTSSTTTTPAATAPATPPPATDPAAPQPQVVPSVGALPSGLLCRDLAAQGVVYADAVRYYKREGYPDRMDADNNGIPCETVYSASSVQAYWGTVRSGSTLGLPSGLLCADLHNRGFDYGSAVEYWIADGFPDRMDADHNGIPCETVYSAVEVRGFWDTVS